MWAFVLFSYSLISPKATPPPPSCAVKRSSSLHWWRVEKQLNCKAADDQLWGGGDLDLLKILFSKKVCCFQTQALWHLSKGQMLLLWCHLFFLSLVYYVHISFSFLHMCLTAALFPLFNMWFSHPSPQCPFALRIHKLWSWRRGHRVHTVSI